MSGAERAAMMTWSANPSGLVRRQSAAFPDRYFRPDTFADARNSVDREMVFGKFAEEVVPLQLSK
jgi:hypothetical protein